MRQETEISKNPPIPSLCCGRGLLPAASFFMATLGLLALLMSSLVSRTTLFARRRMAFSGAAHTVFKVLAYEMLLSLSQCS